MSHLEDRAVSGGSELPDSGDDQALSGHLSARNAASRGNTAALKVLEHRGLCSLLLVPIHPAVMREKQAAWICRGTRVSRLPTCKGHQCLLGSRLSVVSHLNCSISILNVLRSFK